MYIFHGWETTTETLFAITPKFLGGGGRGRREDGDGDGDGDGGGCVLHRLYILFAHVNILGWFCSPLELEHIQINDITRTYACLLSLRSAGRERRKTRLARLCARITRAKGWSSSSLPRERGAARTQSRAHFNGRRGVRNRAPRG